MVGGQHHTHAANHVPIVQEARWAPGSVWMSAENLAPTRIQSLDHPAYSKLLYWLLYWPTLYHMVLCIYMNKNNGDVKIEQEFHCNFCTSELSSDAWFQASAVKKLKSALFWCLYTHFPYQYIIISFQSLFFSVTFWGKLKTKLWFITILMNILHQEA